MASETSRARRTGPCLRPPDPQTAKSDRAIRGGLWFALHRWASLPLWILLFFVCVTGTLATVSHEITWLINPDVRASQGETATHVGYDRIAGAVTERWPQAAIHSIQETEPYLATRVSVSLPEGGHATAYVNPYSGEVQGLSQGVTFPDFMRALHGWLLVPWHNGRSWGYYLVGLLAMPLLLSLITAVVVDKRFWRSLYRPYIRTRLTRRIFWSDLHRVIGTWSIPFVAVIGLTGGFYFVQGVLWDNDITILPPAPMIEREALPVVEGGAPEQVGIDAAVAKAHEAIPGLDLRWISLPESGYHHTEIYGLGDFPLHSDFSVAAYINPYSGDVGGSRDVDDMSFLMWLQGLADPLHFGDFAGLISKLIWFAFGTLLSLMIFSGMLVWHKRTAPVKARAPRRAGEAGLVAEAE
ncbi:PepSY-associated TM helix domain-containing protein [Spectribacter hydrogenoxidans]|uniref:PepSY-associated TM helix domain-containing protein n=1 Tax=Spectribacter hydrogenoxidans TaxID=3075608 RepID=A0ABU3BW18_9GAMM|nr:PepSY-associated TM helix domain-containing protein [Salinisphaera sp. W335]MDT0633491.1 PepSY-associated TM helix domain-containing protein [Salinisphaera sp. W335]